MPTQKQRKALDLIVENHGNVSKSMREAGYDETTAKNPKNLTESKGFQELCEEVGLTDGFILKALRDDINSKPGERSRELAIAVKVRGLEKTSIDITSNGETIAQPDNKLAESFADYLKKQ